MLFCFRSIINSAVMGWLIINLPAPDAFIVCIMAGHLANYPSGQFSVPGARPGIMLPGSMLCWKPAFVHNEYFRVFLGKPCRRSCRRSAHDDFQPMFGSKRNRFVEPGKIKYSLNR